MYDMYDLCVHVLYVSHRKTRTGSESNARAIYAYIYISHIYICILHM